MDSFLDGWMVQYNSASGALCAVPPGKRMVEELRTIIGRWPVYIHINCDVLEPGIVPTEYRVPGGLTLPDMQLACEALAQNEIAGLELAALQPLLDALLRNSC